MDTFPFAFAWWGVDLPGARACDGTYCRFEYDALPPLDTTLLRGEFQWLMPPGARLDEITALHRRADPQARMAARLKALAADAAEKGTTLPAPFIAFMGSLEWQERIPSCTACYFSLSEQLIASPVEQGAYLIRFYNDQQDVLLWYLYLPPSGAPYVVCSPIFFDTEEGEPADVVKAHTVIVAPDFETFLYRWWMENVIWFANEEGDRKLTPEQEAYIAHYVR